jgi:NodT family efflux transporter outer membrane factor (OMF) lipoprotein
MPKPRLIIGGLAALALGGCAVGPNFQTPAPPSVSRYTREPLAPTTAAAEVPGGAAQQFVQGRDVPGQWWTLYQSPALNALVERALKANPDLEAAQAALRVAREAYYAQRAVLLPSVDASYNLQRQQANATLAPPLTSNNDLFTLSTAQVSVAYTPDVFGGLRRQTESVRAQADAQRFQTEATYLTLTTNVVNAAIQAAMLRDQVSATQAIIKSDSDVLEIMRRQFALGEIGRGDVVGQEAVLAQAQQTLPPLEKQLVQAEDLIADLTGRFPSQAEADDVRLASLTLPADLPLSLPSKLVAQRPDIRAAAANLHAASAQVGVAIANRLPNITLSANAGGASTNIGQMFANGNVFWAVSGTATQTIFDAGALKHRQRGAEAAYDQAKAQYRGTVLSAFQNVADTLQALQSDAATLKAAAVSQRSAAESLTIARQQLALGQVSAIVVLNAEQTYQQTLVARIQSQASRYADTAALLQALGGGWWNRTETTDNLK